MKILNEKAIREALNRKCEEYKSDAEFYATSGEKEKSRIARARYAAYADALTILNQNLQEMEQEDGGKSAEAASREHLMARFTKIS